MTTIERYIRSSLLTFVAGFVIAIAPYIQTLDFSNVTNAVLVSVLLAGIRGGIKLALEKTQ